MIARSSKFLPEETIPECHASLGALEDDVTGWRLNESRTNMILVGELEFGWDDTLHQTHT